MYTAYSYTHYVRKGTGRELRYAYIEKSHDDLEVTFDIKGRFILGKRADHVGDCALEKYNNLKFKIQSINTIKEG